MVEEYKLYKQWLDNCTQFDEMPYYNETSETYDCYPIMSVGPCTPGEWFVLNENNPKRAICVEQSCACKSVVDYSSTDYSEIQPELDSDDCEFNYDDDNLVYYTHVEYEGKCQEIRDPSSCPPLQELLPSPFGIGECSCLEGFLPYYDENGTLICHQEFLQGPCKDGEQYIISNEIDDFEPVCNLTNCEENETRFNETCIPVPNCKIDEEIVNFPSERNAETTCINIAIFLLLEIRTDLIGGSKSCKRGFAKNARGKCQKKAGSKKNKGKRSPTSKNNGRVRNVCCNGRK